MGVGRLAGGDVGEDGVAVLLEDSRPYDEIGDGGFAFDGDKVDTFGSGVSLNFCHMLDDLETKCLRKKTG